MRPPFAVAAMLRIATTRPGAFRTAKGDPQPAFGALITVCKAQPAWCSLGGGGSFASCESESRERREAAIVKAVGKAFILYGKVISIIT